eukprot:15179802-Heterocapsa_arctica.AAC.1
MMIHGEVKETSQTRFLLAGQVDETDQRRTKVCDLRRTKVSFWSASGLAFRGHMNGSQIEK